MQPLPQATPPGPATSEPRRRAGLLLLVAGLFAPLLLQAADNELEAKVKAAYLFNLTRFVDWPALPPDEIRICVLGSPAIGSLLSELPNRQVRSRNLRIDQDAAVTPAACQVLFISSTVTDWQAQVAGLQGSSVLTVSDHAGFAGNGGIVGFFLDEGRVKLEINTSAARAAELRISSNLLELARTLP